ncbi:putative transcription factor WD40-like family [Dioscorea sansibarensis]
MFPAVQDLVLMDGSLQLEVQTHRSSYLKCLFSLCLTCLHCFYFHFLLFKCLLDSQVSKLKQMLLTDARDGPVRPVIRTFYDHSQPIYDLDFHPRSPILISGAKDCTIKYASF